MNDGQIEHNGFGPYRREATLLFITFVTAVAFGNGVEHLKDIVENSQSVLSWRHWTLPAVYTITLLRFAVGSYSHMLSLERHNTKNGVWWFDLIIIFVVEMAIIALMAFFFEPSKIGSFAALLVALCFVDAGWVISILPTLPCRPGTGWPWPWLVVQLISGGITLGLLLTNCLSGDRGLYIVMSLFTFVAVVDFYLVLSGLLDRVAWPRSKTQSAR